jgi:hypothetical protein
VSLWELQVFDYARLTSKLAPQISFTQLPWSRASRGLIPGRAAAGSANCVTESDVARLPLLQLIRSAILVALLVLVRRLQVSQLRKNGFLIRSLMQGCILVLFHGVLRPPCAWKDRMLLELKDLCIVAMSMARAWLLNGEHSTGSSFWSHTDVICSFHASVILPCTAMEAGATISGTVLGLEPCLWSLFTYFELSNIVSSGFERSSKPSLCEDSLIQRPTISKPIQNHSWPSIWCS